MYWMVNFQTNLIYWIYCKQNLRKLRVQNLIECVRNFSTQLNSSQSHPVPAFPVQYGDQLLWMWRIRNRIQNKH